VLYPFKMGVLAGSPNLNQPAARLPLAAPLDYRGSASEFFASDGSLYVLDMVT
jgi:hypothetical protein